MTTIIKPYGPKRVVDLDFGDELSMTKQSFANECDINVIMAKHAKTGLIDHVNRFDGQYGDFLDVHDYQTSLNAVMRAEEEFMSLPSKVRARFDNDPSAFLAFVNDANNRDEAQALGLLKEPPAPPLSYNPSAESEQAQLPT